MSETSADAMIATCSAEFGIMSEPGAFMQRRIHEADERRPAHPASGPRSW